MLPCERAKLGIHRNDIFYRLLVVFPIHFFTFLAFASITIKSRGNYQLTNRLDQYPIISSIEILQLLGKVYCNALTFSKYTT